MKNVKERKQYAVKGNGAGFSIPYMDDVDGVNALISGLGLSRKRLAEMLNIKTEKISVVLDLEIADTEILEKLVELFETVRF
jgi:ParB-like chromosome segregation protein Spo0J